MHVDDAAAANIVDGDTVRIASRHGEIELPVIVTKDIVAGVVAVPHGWGHKGTGGWRVANGAGGANVNRLMSSAPEDLEKLAGMARLTGVPVRVHLFVNQGIQGDVTSLAVQSVSVVVQPGTMSGLADETRWMDATEQAALVSKGEVTPSELLEAAIERIERSNPALNAVVIEWFDHARSVAADPDLPDGPFRGVPFLLKDLYTNFAGQTVSNGNVALKAAGKIDAADTTLVARFKAAGLVIAGRTNSPGDGQPADHTAVGLGGDPQPVGAGAYAGWVEWRRRRRGGRRDGPVRQRLGRGREHPHPGVVLRARRTQAEPGADHGRAGACRGGAGG